MGEKLDHVKQVYNLQIRKTKNAISAFFNGALTFTGGAFLIAAIMSIPVTAWIYPVLLGGIGVFISRKGVKNLKKNYKTFKALQDAGTPKTTNTILDKVTWKNPLTEAKGNSNNNKIISVDEFIENGPPVRKR